MRRTWVITGTDTGVGKTVLTALLARHLRDQGEAVRAVKPFSSGSRDDAECLLRAQGRAETLDSINPWHFDQPVAPWIAARQVGRRITLRQTLAYLRRAGMGVDALLVEGAGGLLSPLGARFSIRDVLQPLGAIPLVVCPNRLGAINQARLVFAALPRTTEPRAQLILMEGTTFDASCPSNASALMAFLGRRRVHSLPWLPEGPEAPLDDMLKARLRRILDGPERTPPRGR